MSEIYHPITLHNIPNDFENEINDMLSKGSFIKKNGLTIEQSDDDDWIGDSGIFIKLVEEPKKLIIKSDDENDFKSQINTLIETGWKQNEDSYDLIDGVYSKELAYGNYNFYPYNKIRLDIQTCSASDNYSSRNFSNYKSEHLVSIGYKIIDEMTLESYYQRYDQNNDYVFWKFKIFFWDYNDQSFKNNLIEKHDYSDDGEIINKKFYINGERHGIWEKFDTNGMLQYKGEYRDGEKVGIHEKYYKGKLIEKENYLNGLLDGPYFFDYVNVPDSNIGGERQKGQYKNGKEYGKWEIYKYPSPTSMNLYKEAFIIYHYNNGILDGPFSIAHDGIIKEKGHYENGKKIIN